MAILIILLCLTAGKLQSLSCYQLGLAFCFTICLFVVYKLTKSSFQLSLLDITVKSPLMQKPNI